VKVLLNTCRDGLDFFVIELSLTDECVEERTLGEPKGTITELFDGHTDIVGQIALDLDVKVKVLQFDNHSSGFSLGRAKEEAIIKVENENDIITIEDIIINAG
jgi:hypothetical protein